jgi:hypothetical protein
MIDRIGTLNLHYRVGRGSLAPALTPGLDRALQAGLGEALARSLVALLGDDEAVTVVRELDVPVTLAMSGCALDSQVVDCFSRACISALGDLLSSDPPGDTVMRFADQTEFAGSFIVALLHGSAWERWYYGAFHRYRRADTRATLQALLDESGIEPSALFAWLARHGHLAALLACVPPRDARRLLDAASMADAPDGSAVLIDCARRLLTVLSPADEPAFAERIDAFLVLHPVKPDWTSRASLSAWVVQLLRFALRVQEQDAMPALSRQQRETLHALLAGPFDWLDADWVEAQLCAAAAELPAPQPQGATVRRQLLTVRQQGILRALARSVRNGELTLPRDADIDETIVHLIATAARHAGEDAALDRSVLTVIELAVQATQEAAGQTLAHPQPGRIPDGQPPVNTGPSSTRAAAVEALRAAGPSALELFEAMRDKTGDAAESGQASAMAGVFLLARAVDDMGLHALAAGAGVRVAPLLAGLATAWSGQDLSTDGALPVWCGEAPQALDMAGFRPDALNDALLDRLIERGILDGDHARAVIEADTRALASTLPCATHAAATACLLLRAWAYWLPGLRGSGPLFLLEKSIRRNGSIRVSPRRIDAELDPAPLDIVLKMAGYLAPLAPASWLGGRSIAFTLRDRACAPLP